MILKENMEVISMNEKFELKQLKAGEVFKIGDKMKIKDIKEWKKNFPFPL